MNIGIEATSAAEPQKAGVGNYAYNLLRAIALLRREDHFYTLYLRHPLRQDSGQTWLDSNSSESHLKLVSKVLRFPYLWTQIRLPLEMRISPQDVYFFPSPAIPLIYQPAKSVITVHDVAFLFFPDCFSPMLRGWLNIATARGTSKAKKIIAVSESTRQDLISYYGVVPEKIVVVHHGVHEMYRPLPQMGSTLEVGSISSIGQAQMEPTSKVDPISLIKAIKAKYRIEGSYILCIGTLQKRKNIPRLLQSFYVLKHEHNIPHKLVLVGQRCPDLPEYEIFSTMKRLSLQEDVVWTGYIADRDMPILLNGAELFVFPSLYEGFGMPILEAMACGVPVACSNTSSLPEVIGEAGMMFDPYDIESMTAAIYRALTNEALRKQLRQQGLQRAKGFSWKRCAQKTLDVLEAVCYEK